MKKLLFTAVVVLAIIAIDQFLPHFGLEEHMTTFLRNNFNKMLNWMHVSVLV